MSVQRGVYPHIESIVFKRVGDICSAWIGTVEISAVRGGWDFEEEYAVRNSKVMTKTNKSCSPVQLDNSIITTDTKSATS